MCATLLAASILTAIQGRPRNGAIHAALILGTPPVVYLTLRGLWAINAVKGTVLRLYWTLTSRR
ncbi:hypothetical protein [Streptacidiphilus melanogenes]|uniref:hypothetical protein n=1 Tax=Streptacidiphilus melanogenes TaxID=411235 RepID=UPI0005A75661|nr:hypothetical protein [Streptacidiphilus melanogenes]